MDQLNNNTSRTLYINLFKKALLDTLHGDQEYKPVLTGGRLFNCVKKYLAWRGLVACEKITVRGEARSDGRDWPARGLTMIGSKRLDSLQDCIESVIREEIPGDLIETGVWRGGTTLFMKALLMAYGDQSRIVWVADSFEGLPKPNPELYPADAGDTHFTFSELAVSKEEVEKNFQRFNLLDENVKFLKGWFKDTLPAAPISKLSLMRLDGDMYESTMDALTALYPKLSRGGYVIIDDYGYIESCRKAVHDYRTRHMITEQVVPIDWSGVYWRKVD
jgi:O-methyltransferase